MREPTNYDETQTKVSIQRFGVDAANGIMVEVVHALRDGRNKTRTGLPEPTSQILSLRDGHLSSEMVLLYQFRYKGA